MLSQVSDSASTKEMLRNSGVNVKLLVETVAKVKWQSSLFLRRNASSCRKKKKKFKKKFVCAYLSVALCFPPPLLFFQQMATGQRF